MNSLPAITIILSSTVDHAIGDRGDLLYHISADMKRFKALTSGHPVVMGRKTYESLPKGALPDRRNIVLTRNPEWTAPDVETVGSLDEALRLCSDAGQIFIIGGAELYRQALPMADSLELTLVNAEAPDADTRLPELGEIDIPAPGVWDIDPRSGVEYAFISIPLTSKSTLSVVDDITDTFEEMLSQYGSVDMAESEFKMRVHDDPTLRHRYRQWCRENDTTEKRGFFDYCEERAESNDMIWDNLRDEYDD
ncbi:MAG: dihydrofolate reductase [Duncaniella sp.]|nr:dihydrofolate reductase [Duncaniella sp.]